MSTSTDTMVFQDLVQYVCETSYLESTLALLDWDQQTKLPTQAGAYRSDQVTFLAGQIHRRQTAPEYGEMLQVLADSPLANDRHSDAGATIHVLKRDYDKQIRLPIQLVKALARAASVGQKQWTEARKEDDFAGFEPQLKEIFDLKREQAEALGYDESPYDALLDEFEPGASTREVADVLEHLRSDLVPLVSEIVECGTKISTDVLHRPYPIDSQMSFGREVSEKIGFDYRRGRMDVAHHPFCLEAGPNDCRLTTRFDENFFNTSFFGTLHESGHGIYEQGLRSEFYGLPPGKYCSIGIHESQSRLWENLVGRSYGFWKYFFPRAQKLFTEALAEASLAEFYQAINCVAPSLIRVEADEATYNLHIIIRFQLERAIVEGDLDTADLPAAWNEKYEQFLGISPESDANGVLQDVHWSAGLVGYFPTYSIGNLYASQFFQAATEELGDLEMCFSKGDFQPLNAWLERNIHRSGRCFSGPELGHKVTGQPLSHQPLIQDLRDRLLPIYGL